MNKFFIFIMAFLTMTSCTNDYFKEEEVQEQVVVVSEDYKVMYDFVDMLVYSELFDGLTMPDNPTLDELMAISASVIMTAEFGDTIGEGDCEEVYRVMLAWFVENDPEAEVTAFLQVIIDNEMY